TGAATRKFADPEFDGDPVLATFEVIDEEGETVPDTKTVEEEQPEPEAGTVQPDYDDDPAQPRKSYAHGGKVDIDTEVTYDLDADGGKLRTVQITQYVGETVRTLYTDPEDLR